MSFAITAGDFAMILRRRIPPGDGASVTTFQDIVLIDREDTFCFPGTDQVLLGFKVESTAPAPTTFRRRG